MVYAEEYERAKQTNKKHLLHLKLQKLNRIRRLIDK